MPQNPPHPLRIVLTGGPCAGKTTIADVLSRAFADSVIVIPETASLLISGGFPRWDDVSCLSAFQTSIYNVQIQVEKAYASHHPGTHLVMDRGTVDGAAYWPKGPEDFFRTMGTTEAVEMARYHKVIYLECAAAEDYETYRSKNPSRNEGWSQAAKLDLATHRIWERHPNLHVVKSQTSFVDKVYAVMKLLAPEFGEPSINV